MKHLVISVHKQIGGYNFGLSPKVRKEMSTLFPGSAFPLPHIFVSFEDKMNFEEIYRRLEKHILPLLTGVEVKNLAKHFERIVFFDNSTDAILYEIPLNLSHVEKN